MKKLTILVDLDCIAADTMPAWLHRIYETTGVLATVSDINDWVISNCYPLSQLRPEQIDCIIDEKGFTYNIPAFEGAQENLRLLFEAGHRIYFVTARWGTNCMLETAPWLKKHFPWCNPEKDLIFLHDKFRIKSDILIDDKTTNLQLYRQAHPDAHLFTIDYPYNRFDDEGVFRVAYDKNAWRLFRERIELIALAVNNEYCH